MKKILLLITAVSAMCVGSIRAQTTITLTPTPPAGDTFIIDNVLQSLSLSYTITTKIPMGSQLGTLSTQGDPNQIIPVLAFGGNGNIRLRSEWNYFQNSGAGPQLNTINDPTMKNLLGSAGTPLIVDPSQPVQVLSDRSIIKFVGTDGYKYVLYPYYGVSGSTSFIFLFTQPQGSSRTTYAGSVPSVPQ